MGTQTRPLFVGRWQTIFPWAFWLAPPSHFNTLFILFHFNTYRIFSVYIILFTICIFIFILFCFILFYFVIYRTYIIALAGSWRILKYFILELHWTFDLVFWFPLEIGHLISESTLSSFLSSFCSAFVRFGIARHIRNFQILSTSDKRNNWMNLRYIQPAFFLVWTFLSLLICVTRMIPPRVYI